MWEQIRNAVGQALRSAEKPCISLSGGLDSSTVAAAALGQVQQLSAFCIVAPRLGGSDESRAISALGDMFSYLRLERVDCSDANAYPAVASAELRDDPTLMPLSLFPARLRLWGAVREAGYQTLIDGEGGDELFSICVTAFDAVLRGDWRSVLRHLRWHPGRRAALQRAVVVPLLPKPLRMAWARRQLRHVGFPAYVSPGALQLRELNDARQQYVEALVHQSSRDLFEQWLSLPVPVGATASHDRCAAEFGLRTVSPLLDRRVVELMLALPPSVLLPRGQDRHFQREVLKGRIPESVRMLSKDVRLPDELLPHIVCSQQARASLRDGAVRERLSGWVRFERLDAMLDAIPRGYRPAAVPLWQLECIVTFADWYSRAAAEFGVS